MKVEVVSESGIKFEVELTDEEKKLIKQDLIDNRDEIRSATKKTTTDRFLNEIREIL